MNLVKSDDNVSLLADRKANKPVYNAQIKTLDYGESGRIRQENFINQVFKKYYNVEIKIFYPKLLCIESFTNGSARQDTIKAVAGVRCASEETLSDLKDVLVHPCTINIADKDFYWFKVRNSSNHTNLLPSQSQAAAIRKITYTSGTTAQPKGVMLSQQAILSKVVALAAACEVSDRDTALSILPLSTLLENIGGLYVPLYCGATVSLLAPQRIGISGSSQINSTQLINTLNDYNPTVFIIIPQLLLLLIKLIQEGHKLPASIRFIAMGGAPVSKTLL